MDLYTLPPISFGLEAAYHLLISLAQLITDLVGSSGAGLAVVVLTLAVRLALTPVTVSQVRGEIARVRLAPLLADLQRRHGKDRQRLQKEVAALYQREQASPLAGCLPTLVQMPILLILYGVFIARTIASEPNALLTERFLGVELGQSLAGLIGSSAAAGSLAVFAGLLLALAVLAELSRRRMKASAGAGGGSVETGARTPAVEPPAGAPLMASMQWLPYAVLIPAAVVPLAAGLYLVVSMAWTAVERPVVRKVLLARANRGPAGEALAGHPSS